MRNDLTDITIVMDRSASMFSLRDEAQSAINAFVDDQKSGEGDATLTLIQFDTEIETVFRAVPIQEVPQCELHPRGMTALLDAVGTGIQQTGDRLARMKEKERPGLVVFVVVTDGKNNASHQFTKDQITEMISHQEDKYSWKFTYLGANQDAFAEGGAMGFKGQTIADYSPDKTHEAYMMTSAKVKEFRMCRKTDEDVPDFSYSAAERASLV